MSARTIVAALVALAACTGCATSASRTVARSPDDVVIVRNDGVMVPVQPTLRNSNCGWYDHAAGVCDSIGD